MKKILTFKIKKIPAFVFAIAFAIAHCGCDKYLAIVPDRKLAIPQNLEDLDLMLANFDVLNGGVPNSTEILSDDYYVTDESFNSIVDIRIRNQYCWLREESDNWDRIYQAIFIANTVLDFLPDISVNTPEQEMRADRIKGSALFLKGFYYYFAAQLYSKPYDEQTASDDLGLVLREDSDFNLVSKRATNQETYNEILRCLDSAVSLLPQRPYMLKSAPSRPAAYGLLARTYLSMHQYGLAGAYADSCIRLYGPDSLLNLNDPTDVDINANIPFRRFNREVIFHCTGQLTSILSRSNAKVDSNLFSSYATDDLRKAAFFRENSRNNIGTYSFKGNYDAASNTIFGGIALDEMYLIRAECAARNGRLDEAIEDLNKLLETRWLEDKFIPYQVGEKIEVIKIILAERRKELLFRGIRWTDLRRLKNEGSFSVSPERNINSQNYKLLPETNRYELLIPRDVIEMSGIEQNL